VLANLFEIESGSGEQARSLQDRDRAFADLGLTPEGDPHPPRWDTSRMAAEEPNPTVEVDPTPEAITEAVRAGHLVEAVRAAYDVVALSPGNLASPSLLSFLEEAYDPEAEWHLRADLADSRTCRGREEIAGLWAEWGDSFDSLLMEPFEIFETGGKAVAVVQFSGRIRGSDQQVQMEEVHVFSFRDGMISEVREYPTKSEALKALGLPESATFANRFVKPS
jgi:ketosteroid isomerase-like protein